MSKPVLYRVSIVGGPSKDVALWVNASQLVFELVAQGFTVTVEKLL